MSRGPSEDLVEVSEETRRRLREPQGALLSLREALEEAREARAQGRLVITVGDRTTHNLQEAGLIPDLAVIDGREQRGSAPTVSTSEYDHTYSARNPRGHINLALTEVVQDAIGHTPSLIEVEGEEDLLALLVCATLRVPALVLYGQPGEGIVAISLDEESRQEFEKALDEIKRSR